MATFTILQTSLSILKGFKSRGRSIIPSFFKSETANERPCKSYVKFVLAKDYRDTFPELSSSSWIVHWCRQREPENPNITPHSTACFFFFPMGCCFQWTVPLLSDEEKLFKSHLISVVSIQKESNLIYCSSNGWNTTLLNVIKNLISAPSPNKSIGNMVLTDPKKENEAVIFQYN